MVFLFLATWPHPRIQPQGLDFAWLVDVPVADPIQGQSSTDLSDRRSFIARYRLRRHCVYPAVPTARTCGARLDHLAPIAALFAAMGEVCVKEYKKASAKE
jgi:hypothetical protein